LSRSLTRGAARRAARELRPMASLTLAEGGSRLLSFAFYLVAAHQLSTAGFGELRYTTTLSTLAFVAGQVVVTGLTRELGAARGHEARTSAVLGSSLAAAAAVVGVSGLVAWAAVAAGLLPGSNALGLVVTLAGLAVFQLYYAIGRGLGESLRPALTYLGGSLVQLVVFVAVALVASPGPTLALLVFGLSSFVPVLWLEATRPVVRGRALRVERALLGALWRVGAPLLAAQVGYLIWTSADQIWVASTLDRRTASAVAVRGRRGRAGLSRGRANRPATNIVSGGLWRCRTSAPRASSAAASRVSWKWAIAYSARKSTGRREAS
jgi:hypothetical protein